LAVAASLAGERLATADLDPQATLTLWSRRRPKDIAITHYRVDWADVDGLLDDAELAAYTTVLIDTPPSVESQAAAFARLIVAADTILVPCRPTFDDAESALPFLRHLKRLDKRPIVVMTFVKPRVNINAVKGYLLEAAEICPVEVADRTDYARTGIKGLGVMDIPNHPGYAEISAIWCYVQSLAVKDVSHVTT
jgi:chromosome partitioning protein